MLSDTETAFLDQLTSFARTEVQPSAADWSMGREPDHEIFAQAAKLGLHGLQVPVAEGGSGFGFQLKARVAETLAAIDFGFAMSVINTHNVALKLAQCGGPQLKSEYLPRLLEAGETACTALTEPAAGSDFAAITTRADRVDGGWLLNGEKAWITNGRRAALAIVYAQCAEIGDRHGIAAFLVDLGSQSCERYAIDSPMAQTSIGAGGFRMRDCRVTDEHLIAAPGEAFSSIMEEINGARVYVAAMCLGMLDASVAEVTAFGRQRQSFGKALEAHQGWRQTLARAETDLAAMRGLVRDAVAAVDTGAEAQLIAAQAKVFGVETCRRHLPRLLHAMGAAGLNGAYNVVRHVAAVQSAGLTDGSTEMLLERIAKLARRRNIDQDQDMTGTPQHAAYQPRVLADTDPDRLAYRMTDTGEDVSFAQLEARANQGAHLLRTCDVRIGDHILILMENRREFLEICFAADRSGIYYTTASTHLTFDEISHIAGDCGAKLLIMSEKFLEIGNRLRSLLSPDVRIFLVGGPHDELESWAEASAAQPETPIGDEQQGLDMLYSSGTTGRPKGIKWPLTGQDIGAPTMLVTLLTSLFGYRADTRYLCPAPLYHAAPLRHTMVTLKMGGSAFVMSRFDAETSLQIIERERITHCQWVPTMFVRILKLPEAVRAGYDMSSMEMALHAAAPCPVDVKQRMIDWWGPIIVEYYAGTENNGFTFLDTAEWLAHKGSVGSAKLGVIHICDAHGHEVPSGEEGEVYFENGHQFEYHNDPEKTAQCTNAQGWTTLGDIGRLDEDGYLYLTDRKSFVIISGGVNVYPQEAEDALIGHPAVLDAAVIGVPNEEFGEEVKAVVQLVDGKTPSPDLEAELLAHCRETLSAIKCPRSIDFRDFLPRTETGKLFKRRLRDEYWEKVNDAT